jgi:hypothetical protein
MAIKNSSLSHPHYFFKIKNAKRVNLEKKISELRTNFNANSGEIFRTERDLNNLIELDLREEIVKMKNFEKLSNEKITPYFLSLAKRPHNSECLSDINREDGTPFDNSKQRSDYIVDYYASTYRKQLTVLPYNAIDEFLGDTAGIPAVIGSKLNNDERDELEQGLSLAEFDKAVELAKNNTAPGIDSISNRFIKNFWPFFRKPLFDYALCCYNKGNLTDNFRSAKIHLIPKKGDLSLLKNWRPISLLNCFYKIISRVIAIRLRKVMDKITTVAQKGFSGKKYCQEVLINIVDSINHVNTSRRHGALLSLDIKKAFDSTSHEYLQLAYKFFNFGPNFIRWLNLVGTNRRACIILENEYYSEFFYLERGNAQGDTISPYIFNIGFQILLFKLNFDLQIDGLIPFPVVPDNIPPIPATVGTYSRKINAYADDANMLVKLDYNSLLRIKTILENFGAMSGLVCNLDKTTLTVLGNGVILDDRIRTLGFSIVKSSTILGLEIDCTGYTIKNFEKIRDKIRAIIATWAPFKLSLPGWINIAKSLLYSQINYLGCFLPLPPEIISTIDHSITTFVKGKLNVAKKRLYRPVDQGGLGLFDINIFLDAQRCAWIKRSLDLDDHWKVQLYINNFGLIFNSKGLHSCIMNSPTLHSISRNFENFSNAFTSYNENFRKAYIVENPRMSRAVDSRDYIKKIFSMQIFLIIMGTNCYNLNIPTSILRQII